MRILAVPPAVHDDPDALEMLRAWIVNGELQIVLAAWVWKDEPATWGRLLAEAAGHLADAISKESGQNREAVYARIRERLVADLEDPPSDLIGEFVERPQ